MPVPKPPTPTGQPAKASVATAGVRKPWKKPSHSDVMRKLADKLRAEIAKAEAHLNAKRRELEKSESALKLFEES